MIVIVIIVVVVIVIVVIIVIAIVICEDRKGTNGVSTTPSPPTKSLGFEGFDSSRLNSKGGNSHVRWILYCRESPGKFDSRTLSRETLSRWTGRTTTGVHGKAELGSSPCLSRQSREAPLGHAGFVWGWKHSFICLRFGAFAGWPRFFFVQERSPKKRRARVPPA